MSDPTPVPARHGEETWPHQALRQPAAIAGWPAPTREVAADAGDRLSEPRYRLDPRARRMWLIAELIQALIWTAILVGGAYAAIRFLDREWLWPTVIALAIIVPSLIWAFVGPAIRYRQWRYEIREEEVDLQHGVLVKTRQLVPMSRIQHVDTRRGPLQQRFGLASVVFFTAAGSMEIPALSLDDAHAVRDRIADLAKVHDDL